VEGGDQGFESNRAMQLPLRRVSCRVSLRTHRRERKEERKEERGGKGFERRQELRFALGLFSCDCMLGVVRGKKKKEKKKREGGKKGGKKPFGRESELNELAINPLRTALNSWASAWTGRRPYPEGKEKGKRKKEGRGSFVTSPLPTSVFLRERLAKGNGGKRKEGRKEGLNFEGKKKITYFGPHVC